ncbi:MAG: hypothetical protein KAS74_01545 [Methanosarcinales archaeon]|nr:hypothetical protein [Methanosarcinales archaeon]
MWVCCPISGVTEQDRLTQRGRKRGAGRGAAFRTPAPGCEIERLKQANHKRYEYAGN